ncbi:MAG: glycoside hydrolase family 127 protein [Massilibacteroides sp.]|nr:glycoside hydrolase family 127 protein [Massilibacteroides sp.]
MKQYLILILLSCAVLCGCQNNNALQQQPFKKIKQVDFSNVKIQDNFWTPRLKRHSTTTLAVCIDQIENQTGRIKNFENAAKKEGKHSGIYFDDSDVYKALEGIAYSLINNPDSVLEAKADEWIDKIAAAQEPDGYINTYYTLTGLDKRWTNMHMHEMYCAGHMIEAAVAYYHATGKRKLLDVSIKMAEHMMSLFGSGKRHWVSGHQEIELALVKLYNETQDERYLAFANWLIEERGHGYGIGWNNEPWESEYCQDDKPVREMSTIAGHAVRAMYLYCGMADVAALKNDTGYIDALNRLWEDVVLRKMYITGGIGSSRENEGFTEPYDLPNYDAYCETCASVGMVYWNSRMNQFTGDSKYIDVLERSMYNGALAGVSLNGDRFFYVNPLASLGNHHRKEWYGCACCPSQISRFMPSIGNYIYGVSKDAVWVNLYIGNRATFQLDKSDITLKMETNYPWQGKVKLTVENFSSPTKKEIRLRIPGWCDSYNVLVNGEREQNSVIEKGYVVVCRKWKSGDKIELALDMPVEVVASDPRVNENKGKRAIQRGPLVYCVEEMDNADSFEKLSFSSTTAYSFSFISDLLDGIVAIKANESGKNITLIPYYAWDNRDAGQMKVWIDYMEMN